MKVDRRLGFRTKPNQAIAEELKFLLRTREELKFLLRTAAKTKVFTTNRFVVRTLVLLCPIGPTMLLYSLLGDGVGNSTPRPGISDRTGLLAPGQLRS
ncbi:MAG: hypothetical protein AB4352_03630 [Hormoscilla sp.]